ncbi:MAG: transporter ATP-binding protein [Burkholderiales bacterium]|jgi:phospholipid/cholesterol/gamma-HCH transport system ATP-binding protein|nr:transporter ATP-binding protein [Burkholderiales bacterium]
MENIVSIKNVTFGYDEDKPILKNISLSIPQGKITAIMGGSGSGKTTLLRLISGQYKANKGSVKVFGQEVGALNNREILKLRRNCGMLFQFGALFTDMSVYENVAFSLKEHTNLPEAIIDKIVAMKLEAVGLFGTQNMMPQELSGGMARRIALARSIALDPKLMLYDEPFTGLDPISLNVSAMLIKKLNDALGQTSILVTHDIEASLKIVDYIYFMADGEVVAAGTPEEVQKTDNPIVRQFVDGKVNGPFSFEYNTPLDYTSYMGLPNQMRGLS